MNNTPKLFFATDFHGHYRELMGLMQTLYVHADFQPERDTFVAGGDYAEGGPDSRQVIEWCMDMAAKHPHWVFLKGNHCDMLLDAVRHDSRIYHSFYQWWDQGGAATAASYLSAQPERSDYERAIMQPADYLPAAHLDWLEARPLIHETDRYLFVHAGLRPGLPLAAQTQEDLLWIREDFIQSDDAFGGKRVIAGHTAMKKPLVLPNKIMIDTMLHDRGQLTAAELRGPVPVFYFQEAVAGPWPD